MMKTIFVFLTAAGILACSNGTVGGSDKDSTTANTADAASTQEAKAGSDNAGAAAAPDSATGKKPDSIAVTRRQQPLVGSTVRTLKDVYKNYFLIGVAVNPTTDFADPQRVNLIKSQYNYISAKRGLQPFVIQPKEGVFDWREGDMLVNFAQQNNMKVMGAFLAYARAKHMPAWFYKDANGNLVSKDVLLKRLKDHITATLTHYKGKIYTWQVVDEAITSSRFGAPFSPVDTLYKIAGEDYITKAFQYAHEVDPSAKLFYNDYIYDRVKSDNMYEMVKKWKQQGVPIDGVGIQCHYGAEGVDKALLQKDIDRYAALGLEIQVTELDVSIFNRSAKPDDNDLDDNFNDNKQTTQGNVFKDVFDVCRRNRGKVTAITIFGADDAQETYLTTKYKGKRNYPYLFDANKNPKKAFKDVTDF